VLAARDGRQFLSTVMARCSRFDAARKTAIRGSHGHETPGSSGPETTHNHRAHFYPDDSSLVSGFASFAEDALKAGSAVIMLLTKTHCPAFLRSLQARGVDIDPAMNAGRLVLLDVDETLEKFMVDDQPDPARFFRVAGDIVSAVKTANREARVVASGECAPTLWAGGNGYAAIQLEHLWDRLVGMFDLETLCGYVLKSPQRGLEINIYQGICAAHSAVQTL
jgi:hypothetical protein